MHSFKKNLLKTVLVSQKAFPDYVSLSTSAVFNQSKLHENQDTIVIPNRIERGPTDILKALSLTVKKDPLAPHYKYHDDPFTIPVSNMGKRSFALAQESGRKSAQWVKDQHSDLFHHKVADPPIEIFAPKVVFNEEEPVSPELLSKLIANASVTDAIKAYQKLSNDNVEVNDDLKQSLLELVCFQNCEDSIADDHLEERWFTQNKYIAPRHNTWKDNDFAESLFRSFPEPGVPQYASLIQGMLKYNQVERALSLIEEAKGKGLELPVEVYNLVLGRVNFVKESFDQRWEMIAETLALMNQARLTPTIDTLNEILKQLSFMASFRDAKKLALKTLSEMRKFNVKPSLASYNHLLYLFCRDRGPTSGILYSILDDLEARIQNGETLQVQDIRDNSFFAAVMEIAKRHLSDVSVAYRIDKLLHTGDNYNFIGESANESNYYRNFFTLVMTEEPFETFMQLYDRLVPNVYSPEKSIMIEFIKVADLHGKIEYFPRIWSELVMLEHWQQEDTLSLFLETINRNLSAASPQLLPQLADTAWSVYSKVAEFNDLYKERRSGGRALDWTAVSLGHIMNILLADARMKEVNTIFIIILKEDLAGVPEFSTIEKYFNAMAEEKNLSRCMVILQYLSDMGFSDLQPLADRLASSIELSPSEQNKVLSLVGNSKPERRLAGDEELEVHS